MAVGGPGTLADLAYLSGPGGGGGGPQPPSHSLPSPPLPPPGVMGAGVGGLGGLPGSTTAEREAALGLLSAAQRSVPVQADSEWPGPRNPAPAPSSYPSTILPLLDNPALFAKLDLDALFFAFYYMRGTHQQLLAARELKRQSWRFHKKYNTWFQRHEEPKASSAPLLTECPSAAGALPLSARRFRLLICPFGVSASRPLPPCR